MSETGTEALVGLCAEPGCGAVVMCSVLEADRPKRDIANFAADAVCAALAARSPAETE
jgi:hypothetical protein